MSRPPRGGDSSKSAGGELARRPCCQGASSSTLAVQSMDDEQLVSPPGAQGHIVTQNPQLLAMLRERTMDRQSRKIYVNSPAFGPEDEDKYRFISTEPDDFDEGQDRALQMAPDSERLPQQDPRDTQPGSEQHDARPGYEQRDARPGYEQHDARPGYEQRDARPGYEQHDARPGYEQRDARPGYEQRDARPGYEQRDARPGYEQRDDQPGSDARQGYEQREPHSGFDPHEPDHEGEGHGEPGVPYTRPLPLHGYMGDGVPVRAARPVLVDSSRYEDFEESQENPAAHVQPDANDYEYAVANPDSRENARSPTRPGGNALLPVAAGQVQPPGGGGGWQHRVIEPIRTPFQRQTRIEEDEMEELEQERHYQNSLKEKISQEAAVAEKMAVPRLALEQLEEEKPRLRDSLEEAMMKDSLDDDDDTFRDLAPGGGGGGGYGGGIGGGFVQDSLEIHQGVAQSSDPETGMQDSLQYNRPRAGYAANQPMNHPPPRGDAADPRLQQMFAQPSQQQHHPQEAEYANEYYGNQAQEYNNAGDMAQAVEQGYSYNGQYGDDGFPVTEEQYNEMLSARGLYSEDANNNSTGGYPKEVPDTDRPQALKTLQPDKPAQDYIKENKTKIHQPPAQKTYGRLHVQKKENKAVVDQVTIKIGPDKRPTKAVVPKPQIHQGAPAIKAIGDDASSPEKLWKVKAQSLAQQKEGKLSGKSKGSGAHLRGVLRKYPSESRVDDIRGDQQQLQQQPLPRVTYQPHPSQPNQKLHRVQPLSHTSPRHQSMAEPISSEVMVSPSTGISGDQPIRHTVLTEDGQKVSVDINLKLLSPTQQAPLAPTHHARGSHPQQPSPQQQQIQQKKQQHQQLQQQQQQQQQYQQLQQLQQQQYQQLQQQQQYQQEQQQQPQYQQQQQPQYQQQQQQQQQQYHQPQLYGQPPVTQAPTQYGQMSPRQKPMQGFQNAVGIAPTQFQPAQPPPQFSQPQDPSHWVQQQQQQQQPLTHQAAPVYAWTSPLPQQLNQTPTPVASPYKVLPPIGSADTEQGRDHGGPLYYPQEGATTQSPAHAESGYMAAYHKQKANHNYQEYSLRDYRKMNKEVKLGSLGPDLDSDTLKEKKEKFNKKQEYANYIKERNRTQYKAAAAAMAEKNAQKTRQTSAESDDILSRRRTALEYSKSVPKPKSVSKPNTGKSEPNLSSARMDTQLEMIDLQKLQQRHEQERQQVAMIHHSNLTQA